MKKIVLMVLALVLIMMPVTALAVEDADQAPEEEVVEKIATPSGENVKLDGEDIKIDAYLIEGENYLKLRDVAALLKDTDAKFLVTYNEEEDNITVTLGEEHDEDFVPPAEDGEKAEKVGIPSYQPIFDKDGKEIELKGYLIEGNNYFRLRDLGKKMIFGVAYDFENEIVILDTINPEIADIKADAPEVPVYEAPINEVETDAGVQKITFLIYGFEACPHCRNLKAFLDEQGIEYFMVDIREDQPKREEVYEEFYTKFDTRYARVYYPTHIMTLVKEDGETISKGVMGFKQEKYEEIFSQIKANKYFE